MSPLCALRGDHTEFDLGSGVPGRMRPRTCQESGATRSSSYVDTPRLGLRSHSHRSRRPVGGRERQPGARQGAEPSEARGPGRCGRTAEAGVRRRGVSAPRTRLNRHLQGSVATLPQGPPDRCQRPRSEVVRPTRHRHMSAIGTWRAVAQHPGASCPWVVPRAIPRRGSRRRRRRSARCGGRTALRRSRCRPTRP